MHSASSKSKKEPYLVINFSKLLILNVLFNIIIKKYKKIILIGVGCIASPKKKCRKGDFILFQTKGVLISLMRWDTNLFLR